MILERIRQIGVMILGAGALLLTGCAKETDLSARYPEYMKYCFGDGYSMEYLFSDDSGNDSYRLQYQDSTGKARTFEDTSELRILPYGKCENLDEGETKQEYYDSLLKYLVIEQIERRFREEVTEKVIKPSFLVYNPDAEDVYEELGGASFLMTVMPLMNETLGSKEDLPFIQKQYQPETGFQVCRTDLKSVAGSELWYVMVTVTAAPDADAEQMLRRTQEAYRRYCEEAGTPQNYSFLFKQELEDGSLQKLWSQNAVFGEPVDMDAVKREKGEVYTVFMEARDRLRAKQ